MGDYRAAGRCGTVIIRESAGDELVGEAVEAVAAQSLLGEGQRQAVELVACRDRAVKGGVEAGDLRNGCGSCRESTDACEVVRLVQRGQRHEALARAAPRSEERSVGKEGVSTCSSRWSPGH